MPKLLAAISGTVTMAIQMCVIRMIAPWFGSSSLVWAVVIGFSLVAMSSGYAIGGKLADRRSNSITLACTLSAAAALIAIVPLTSSFVLPRAALGITNALASTLVGTAVSVGVLFFLPALLLGITLPFTARLMLTSVTSSGSSTGSVYAVSTVGSIIGTLVTALVLLQWIGTRNTLWLLAALLLLGAAIARQMSRRGAGVVRGVPDLVSSPGSGLLGIPAATAIIVVEGMATMGTEMSVARLIGPFFGGSQVVWAILIAVVMGCIAIGSWMGGRFADLHADVRSLTLLMSLSAVAIAVLPVAAGPLMRLSTGGIEDVDVPVVVGTFLATMLLTCVPVTLLGMIPPWVVRLSVTEVSDGGRTVGRLYASSTIGALIGTFAAALWLIPAIGTRSTLLCFALLLAVVISHVALRQTRSFVPVGAMALTVLLLVLPAGRIKPLENERVLEERESRYQYIQVRESADGTRRLSLNEGWATHSVYRPNTVLTNQIWDNFLVLGDLLDRPAQSMLVIGNAAGTTARSFGVVHPNVRIDGVEVDPEVSALGNKYFGMDEANLSTTAADGRPFLRFSDKRWDIIQVDAYKQPYIPFHLSTREFFASAKDHLTPGGAVAINVGTTPGNYEVSDAIAATLREEFPIVVRYRAEKYNDVVVAMNEPTEVSTLKKRLDLSAIGTGTPSERPSLSAYGPALQDLYASFADGMAEVEPRTGRVLTDDHAPVEWMTNSMILHAAQGEQ